MADAANKPSARGKYVAAVLLLLGAAAALAEWKFRPAPGSQGPLNPAAPMPATQP